MTTQITLAPSLIKPSINENLKNGPKRTSCTQSLKEHIQNSLGFEQCEHINNAPMFKIYNTSNI